MRVVAGPVARLRVGGGRLGVRPDQRRAPARHAAAAIWYGYGLRFIPIAVLLGCATHITGDMLTDSGCMLGYPWSRQRFHLLPEPLAFTTGTLPELLIIDPILSGALLALAVWIIDPVWLRAQWGPLAG